MEAKFNCKKPTRFTWAQEVLTRNLPNIKPEGVKGLDKFRELHNAGRLEEKHYVSFLKANRQALAQQIPFVKWGTGLSIGNIAHSMFYMESEIVIDERIETAFSRLTRLIENVKQAQTFKTSRGFINKIKNAVVKDPSLEERMSLVFRMFTEVGDKRAHYDADACCLSDAMNRAIYNCQSASFALLSIAQELNDFPLRLVHVPRHVFVRYDDGNYRFNHDQGATHSDDYYKNEFKISDKEIAKEDYLKGLNIDESFGVLCWSQEAQNRFINRKETKILSYLEKEIEIDPKNPDLYVRRAKIKRDLAYFDHDCYLEAISDLDTAIGIAPKNPNLYTDRAEVRMWLKDHLGAMSDYNKAIKVDPENPDLYVKRAGFKGAILCDYLGAISDLDTAIGIAPKNPNLYTDRAEVRMWLKDHLGAISDLDTAIEIDPENPSLYVMRANHKCYSGDFLGAISDLETAKALDLEVSAFYDDEIVYVRARAKEKMGDIEGIKSDRDHAGALKVAV